MELKKQLWIALQAIARLLWLLVQEVSKLVWAASKYIYRHRREIARYKLTIPALIILSVFWTGFRVLSDVKSMEQSREIPMDDSNDAEPIVQFSSHTTSADNDRLFEHINDWIGTPQRDGRNSKSGTDCSGFVQAVYKEALDIELSRSSEEMYRNDVEKINKAELSEGDLVFFNTYGSGVSHVGIYMGEGKFAHTSTSKGVTVDAMDSPYYVRNYYASGRIKGNM
ncbi:C40 family peptidase [Rhodocytophaga rosea]|uniref:C40 family peptidase n=1 Tax=Rhodocytophaga rosea TaxID=2704465 RepID=A0A6C0GLP9_9BACT|nr:C40 family peptidase [Rhodocytophaga rosea]QHT68552.1 C40 family peptidase [Rhodocytophaga rosea]